MDWTPYALFVISGIAMTGAQRLYFDELATRGGLTPDAQVAQEILGRPRARPSIAARETVHRLRSLLTRQRDSRAERLRMLALLSIAVTLGSFAWMMMTLGGPR